MAKTQLEDIKKLRETLEGTDFYENDTSFSELLKELDPDQFASLEGTLRSFSSQLLEWDELIERADQDYPGPWIRHYNSRKVRVDEIMLPAPVRQVRKEVVEAGIHQNTSELELFSKVYLLAHLSESSIICPLACTEGLIRSIESIGSEFLQEKYLPKLRSPDTPLAGAQFVTEKDAGSDVGAIVTKAVPEGSNWKLHGEKWFCSAVDEYFLVAARPTGAASGTKGIGIFFVPRTIDGTLNNLEIKRLKPKSGTLLLPTAEIDFNGAEAYAIGPPEDGFKNLMQYVLNTSRVMNAAGNLGMMSRAYLEAKNYATQRETFGHALLAYPMISDKITKLETNVAVHRTIYFDMVHQLDQNPDVSGYDALWQRFLINVNKYRISQAAKVSVEEAREIFGGNGIIKDFSPIPRLAEDAPVLETWEGPHNILALQICRDALSFDLKQYIDDVVYDQVRTLRQKEFTFTANYVAAQWDRTREKFEKLTDPAWVSVHARHLVDNVGGILELGYFASFVARRYGKDSREASQVKYFRNNLILPSLESPEDRL